MDPQLMLERLRDDDDRWDGVEYRAVKFRPAPRSAWRPVFVAVAAGLVVGVVVTAAVVGLRGTRPVAPSVDASSPTATSTPLVVPPSSAPTAPPTSGIESGLELNNDFEWEAQHFPKPLAPGYDYPTPKFEDSSVSYEAGMGASMVASFWVCTWEVAYLKAAEAHDATAQAAALVQIDAFGGMPVTKEYMPDWDVDYRLHITPAKKGNLKPLREDVGGGSCPVMGLRAPGH